MKTFFNLLAEQDESTFKTHFKGLNLANIAHEAALIGKNGPAGAPVHLTRIGLKAAGAVPLAAASSAIQDANKRTPLPIKDKPKREAVTTGLSTMAGVGTVGAALGALQRKPLSGALHGIKTVSPLGLGAGVLTGALAYRKAKKDAENQLTANDIKLPTLKVTSSENSFRQDIARHNSINPAAAITVPLAAIPAGAERLGSQIRGVSRQDNLREKFKNYTTGFAGVGGTLGALVGALDNQRIGGGSLVKGVAKGTGVGLLAAPIAGAIATGTDRLGKALTGN